MKTESGALGTCACSMTPHTIHSHLLNQGRWCVNWQAIAAQPEPGRAQEEWKLPISLLKSVEQDALVQAEGSPSWELIEAILLAGARSHQGQAGDEPDPMTPTPPRAATERCPTCWATVRTNRGPYCPDSWHKRAPWHSAAVSQGAAPANVNGFSWPHGAAESPAKVFCPNCGWDIGPEVTASPPVSGEPDFTKCRVCGLSLEAVANISMSGFDWLCPKRCRAASGTESAEQWMRWNKLILPGPLSSTDWAQIRYLLERYEAAATAPLREQLNEQRFIAAVNQGEFEKLRERAEKAEAERDRLQGALRDERLKVLAEIHAYQVKMMWDGAISFMKKDIPDYELAASGPAPTAPQNPSTQSLAHSAYLKREE